MRKNIVFKFSCLRLWHINGRNRLVCNENIYDDKRAGIFKKEKKTIVFNNCQITKHVTVVTILN